MPLDTENKKEIEEVKEKDTKEKSWPWPDSLRPFKEEKIRQNARLLAKDALFVSLFLFLLLSWFEWRNPGAVRAIFLNLHLLLFLPLSFSLMIFHKEIEDFITQKILNKKIAEIIAWSIIVISILVYSLVIYRKIAYPLNISPLRGWESFYFFVIITISFAVVKVNVTKKIFLLNLTFLILLKIQYLLGENQILQAILKNLELILSASFLVISFKLFYNNKEKIKCGSLSAKKTIFILFLITVLGLFLRIYNLDFLNPVSDEYRHLIALKRFFIENYFEYKTSLLTTYLLIFTKKIAGFDSVFLMRIPFVVMGTLSIFLIYLIGRKINRQVGLISAFLLATMPIAVGLSRYIRGYSMEIFLILIFILIQQSKLIKSAYLKLVILPSIFIAISFLNNDNRLSYAAGLFSLFCLFQYLQRFMNKRRDGFRISNFIFITGFLILILQFSLFLSPLKQIHVPIWDYLYFFNLPSTSYNWFPFFVPPAVIVFIFLFPFLNRNKIKMYLPLLLTCVMSFIVFIFYLKTVRTFQPRYLFSTLPYFIIPFSYGIFLFNNFIYQLFPIKRAYVYKILTLMLIFLVVQKGIFLVLNEKNGQIDGKTGLPHLEDKEVLRSIKNRKINIDKTLVSTPWIFDYNLNQPFLKEQEKERFVHFPSSQWFEYYDRTKIFSINGYWSDHDMERLKKILNENNEIRYLILYALLEKMENNPSYKSSFLENNINNLKLIETIDNGGIYGFFIFEVERPPTENRN